MTYILWQKSKAKLYQTHLDQVSRSFAFCIKRLQEPLREYVGLSYLLFRILDTVEDAPWLNKASQRQSFAALESFIELAPDHSTWALWRTQFPEVESHEDKLLDDSYFLILDLHVLPVELKAQINKAINNMRRGMEFYALRENDQGFRLKTLVEVNRYCFFVAGLIGELLEYLFLFSRGQEHLFRERDLTNAFHFGLFLQKVNILKDQQEDEKVGRFLVPSRGEVIESVRLHADHAFDYLKRIPADDLSYRLFCAWSLFLGLASLPWIEKSWAKKMKLKIPRFQAQAVLSRVSEVVYNNDQLQKLFQEMSAKISWPQKQASVLAEDKASSFTLSTSTGDELSTGNGATKRNEEKFPEFETLYTGSLKVPNLIDLGMVSLKV